MAGTKHPSQPDEAGLSSRKKSKLAWILSALILLLAAYLVFAPKPWSPHLDFSPEAKISVRTHSYVIDGMWWASLINLLLIAAILGALRFYPGRIKTNRDHEDDGNNKQNISTSPENTKSPHPGLGTQAWASLPYLQKRIILALTLLTVAFSAYINAPQLSHSLWGDEEATARRYIIGHISRQSDGSMRLSQPSWEKTLWNFDNGPNNHVLFSVLGRLSHGFASLGDGPQDYYFSESWIRLPSFLAGIGAVAAIAWLMITMGFPRTAPLASAILALHPWFVRWGTEARGYSLKTLLALLLLIFLLKVLQSRSQTRTWIWWICFGLGEFLMIWAHLGAVYFLVPLNLAAMFLVWKKSLDDGLSGNPLRQPNCWHLIGANMLGAILTIQVMSPCLKPLRIWLGSNRIDGDINREWLIDWFSYFSSGMPWYSWKDSNPYCLPLPRHLAEHPLTTYALLILIGMAFVLGTSLLVRNNQMRILLIPLLLPGPLTVIHAKIGGNLLYPWYMVGFLPLFLVVITLGLEECARLLRKPSVFPGIALVFLILFGMTTHDQRQLYREHPVEALAESVRLTRKVINPFHPDIDEVITLDIAHATRLYDPAHRKVRSLDAFIEALELADSTNRPLFLNLANLGLLRRELPGIWEIIDNREIFANPTLIHGLQVPCTRYIFRYHPHSIQNALNASGEDKK